MSGYAWVRFRTRHSHGPGQWQVREFELEGLKHEARLVSILDELNYELTTGSEHWRGVEGDWYQPTAKELRAEIRSCRAKAKRLRERCRRYQDQIEGLKA